MKRRKAIELYQDSNFLITETPEGTKITGLLAYPGISKNLKLYTIDQLMAGHDRYLPVWLNHAGTLSIQDIGPDLLPDSYRQRLINGEIIKLGTTHLIFDTDTFQLKHETLITDPFYKRPEVLRRMSVSQGVLHFPITEKECDSVACYGIIRGSEYQEMSLVFHPGFSIASISIENDNAYELRNYLSKLMSDKDNSTEGDCGCEGSTEVDQAAGVMSEAGNCGEGMTWNMEEGKCVPVTETGKAQSNPGSKGVTSVPGHEGTGSDTNGKTIGQFGTVQKAKENLTKAEEDLKKANEVLEKARKAAKEASEDDDMPSGDKESPSDSEKKQKSESKKNSTENDVKGYPNADQNSRRKAQEAYNDALEKKYKAMENLQLTTLALTKASMIYQAENAQKKAFVGQNTQKMAMKKAVEAANLGPKQWIDSIIKSPESAPWHKTWIFGDEYTSNFVTKKFKSTEGTYLRPKYTPYNAHMEKVAAVEATDVSMAGGADPNNFQRTLSELVLVYPNGIIVTPIQQFCETGILAPGKKEHLFYDVNVPDFAATDEADMDAAGSGYALAPSDIVINASGGKTNAQGGLVRIGFTQLEEIPIDIIQKTNIGFAMRAEERKNFDVLTTCYDDDTPYDPATMAVRPRGGGDKGATDNQGNTHWVNGNNGTQLTTTDSAATGALKFVGLLAAKETIGDTGLSVENVQTYLPYGGILQLLKDTDITTYTQRSVPEVITEGMMEEILGTQLIATSGAADGDAAGIKRAVMFLPIVSFGFVTGRELQVDAERVARQQSVFCTASMKMASFCKRIESTCRVSFKPKA